VYPLTSAMSVGFIRISAHIFRSAMVADQPFSRTSRKKSPTVRLWKL